MVKGRTRKWLLGGVFVAAILAGFSSRSVDATDMDMFIDSSLSVSFPSLIVIDAAPNYTGIQTAKASLKVSTNNEDGYITIFSVVGSKVSENDTSVTDLKNKTEGAFIPTLTEQKTKAAFPLGYWGYSLDGGENYRGITAYNDSNRLVISSGQAGAADITNFTFGVRVDNTQPAGLYSNTLLITTVAQVQDIPEPASFSPKAIYTDSGHLSFVYDNNEYNIGDTYINNYTSSAVHSVYSIPVNTTDNPSLVLGWLGANGEYPTVNAIDFEPGFSEFAPVRTNGWFSNMSSLRDINGIENFNTSQATDMSHMFEYSFTSGGNWSKNIGKLDVSAVTNMASMFRSASGSSAGYTVDLSDWDTSNVTSMDSMFSNSGTWSNKIVGLERFDTSNVVSMSYMFYKSGVNNVLDLSNWNTSSVISMSSMFGWQPRDIQITFGQSWDMSNVIEVTEMFYSPSEDGAPTITLYGAAEWKFDSLEWSPSRMFGGTGLIADLHGWDFSNISSGISNDSFNTLFSSSRAVFNVDASDWILPSHITSLKNMFSGTGKGDEWTLDASGWNVENITDLSYLFYNSGDCNWNLDVSGWDTSNVTDINHIFSSAAPNDSGGRNSGYVDKRQCTINLVGTETWNTGKVTDMSYAFYRFGGAQWRDFNHSYDLYYNDDEFYSYPNLVAASGTTFNGGIESWTTDKVTNMYYMFGGTTINARFAASLANWNTEMVTSMYRMFFCSTVVGGELDLSGWDVSGVSDMSYLFNGMSGYADVNITNWNTSNVTNMSYMFGNYSTVANSYGNRYYETDPTHIKNIIGLGSLDVHNVTNFSYMFYGFQTRTAVWDLSSWNVSAATDVRYMFASFRITGDLNQNGGHVTEALINLSGWNLSGITSARAINIFDSFSLSTAQIWNSSTQSYDIDASVNLTTLRIDVDGWDVRNIASTSYMFANITIGHDLYVDHHYPSCTLVIDGLDSWNVGNVTNMSYMFYNTEATIISLDLSSWDTHSVTNMSNMFASLGNDCAISITIDMSGIDTSHVTNMSNMFADTGLKATVFDVDISGWDVSSVTNHDNFVTRLMLEPHWNN